MTADRPRVSVIIPTLNAAGEVGALLDSLASQTVRPGEVLVVDSSSGDGTAGIVRSHTGVRLEAVRREDFDHGGTRNDVLGMASGDLVLFLTQDALPADDRYIEHLIAPFSDQRVALAYGRQLPKPGARRYVQLVQGFNYPAEPEVRTAADIGRLGIRAYFCSDACSAYRRGALERIGGIPHPCSTNEDMLAACRLLRAGFKVAYAPDACVLHSHNLTFRQQFRRNREVGRFLKEHASELEAPSEIREGGRLVGAVASVLLRERRIFEFLIFGFDCIARFTGNRVGRSCTKESDTCS